MVDPITGLPQDVPDRVVNQIVLGQQTFPWRDLKATERPKRPSIYGDDLIPTASLVTGQDDTGENRAARMTADRRLMVDTGASSGGGSSPFTMDPSKFHNGANSWIITRGTSGQFDGAPLLCKTIYGIFVACYATQNNTTAAVGRYCEFRCYNSTDENYYLSLITVPISFGFTGYAAPDENSYYSMTFDPGIDVLSSLGGDGHVTLWTSQVNVNCDMHVTLISSTS